jgi:hypothetical protein
MKYTKPLLAKRLLDSPDIVGESSRRRINSPSPTNNTEENLTSNSTTQDNVLLGDNNISSNSSNSSSTTSTNIITTTSPVPANTSPGPANTSPAPVSPIAEPNNPNTSSNGEVLYYRSGHRTFHTRQEIVAAAEDLTRNDNPSFNSKRVAYLCDDFCPNPNRQWDLEERDDAAASLEGRVMDYDAHRFWRVGPIPEAMEGDGNISPTDSGINTPEADRNPDTGDSSDDYSHAGPNTSPVPPRGPRGPGGPGNVEGPGEDNHSDYGSGSDPGGNENLFSLDLLKDIIMSLDTLSSLGLFHIIALIYTLYKFNNNVSIQYGYSSIKDYFYK